MGEPISEINTIITLEYLQNQKEHQYFERKGLGEKDIKPSKIADELIGMLNADGGVLAFGVSDSGIIQDISSLEKLDDYRKLVFNFIHPPCNIELEEILVDNKLVFLFHVEQELERVFCREDNKNVFLRVFDENRLLDRDRIKKLEYDKSIRRFEEELIQDFDTADLDVDLLNEYKEKLNYKGEVLELLSKRHLVSKVNNNEYKFKKAAALIFATDPEKYIPSASVRYIRYDGTESLTGTEHNVIKDERFENNIPRLIDKIKEFLKASFKDYYFLDINVGKFVKVAEYPEEAWLEGIVNALCHRSYNIQGNSIYIKHFDNRIEISNSGPLPAQVTVENIKNERFARNPRIARVLEDLGYVRQLNEGVSRIYESMEKSMLSLPEYREVNSNVYLILRNKISGHSKTVPNKIMNAIENVWVEYNETQKRIILYLFLNHDATVTDFVEYTHINENTVRSYLNSFINDGLIERKSTKKRDINAKYLFKKD